MSFSAYGTRGEAKTESRMPEEKYFTLDEARDLLPELRHVLQEANKELDLYSGKLQDLNQRFSHAEMQMENCQAPAPPDGDESNPEYQQALHDFREKRAEFEACVVELSREQSEFLRRLETWVDKIDSRGVILRKLKEGLLDFPARQGDFKYYLCWKLDEEDITHWHLLDDGFIGRRSLNSLHEYY